MDGAHPRWIRELDLGSEPATGAGSAWLVALEDGSVLVAIGQQAPAGFALLAFSAEGVLQARAELDPGDRIAAAIERGDQLLLALSPETRVGGGRVLQLDAQLQRRGQLQLEDEYVHGLVPSRAQGLLRSDLWLLSDSPATLGRSPQGFRTANARVVRPELGPSLSALTPSVPGLLPQLVLNDDSLLAIRALPDGDAPEFLRITQETVQRLGSVPRDPPTSTAAVQSLVADSSGTSGLVNRSTLVRWDADGEVQWSRSLAESPDSFELSKSFSVFAAEPIEGPVCALELRSRREFSSSLPFRDVYWQCFDRDSGQPLFVPRPVYQLLPNQRLWLSAATVDAGADAAIYLRLVDSIASDDFRTVQIKLAAEGQREVSEFVSRSASSAAAGCGSTVLPSQTGALVGDCTESGGTLLRFDASGGLQPSREWVQSASTAPLPLALGEQGDVLALEPSMLVGLGPGLETRWTQPLALYGLQRDPLLPGLPTVNAQAPRGLNDRWVLHAPDDVGMRLMLIDTADGALRFDQRLVASDQVSPQRAVQFSYSAQLRQLVISRQTARGIELRGLELARLNLGPSRWIDRPSRFLRAGGTSASAISSINWVLSDSALRVTRTHAAATQELPTLQPIKALLAAADRPLQREHSGLWYDPQISGQGLLVDVEARRGRYFAAWFTYDGRGGTRREGLRWYSLLGQGSGSAVPIDGILFESSGGDFSGTASPATVAVGGVELLALDCNTLEFRFAVQSSDAATAVVGTRRLQQLLPALQTCADRDLTAAVGSDSSAAASASWVIEGRASQGVLMQVQPASGALPGGVWGAWFGYAPHRADEASAQYWLSLVGRPDPTVDGVFDIDFMRTLGGRLDADRTENTRRVGGGRLRFDACDRAQLDYRFDTPGLAGDAFAGLTGTMMLRRFEPCSAGQ